MSGTLLAPILSSLPPKIITKRNNKYFFNCAYGCLPSLARVQRHWTDCVQRSPRQRGSPRPPTARRHPPTSLAFNRVTSTTPYLQTKMSIILANGVQYDGYLSEYSVGWYWWTALCATRAANSWLTSDVMAWLAGHHRRPGSPDWDRSVTEAFSPANNKTHWIAVHFRPDREQKAPKNQTAAAGRRGFLAWQRYLLK